MEPLSASLEWSREVELKKNKCAKIVLFIITLAVILAEKLRG